MSNTNTKTTIKSKLKPKLKLSEVNILRVLLKEVKLLKSTPGFGSLFHVLWSQWLWWVHCNSLQCE